MRLDELKKQAEALGLTVSKSGHREAKHDYERVLRAYYLKRDHPDGLPFEELSPMLCSDSMSLSLKEQQTIWDDDNWIVQQKFNGIRLIVHFVEGVGVFAHSRVVSETTFRRVDLTSRLLFHDFVPDFTATVDCEAVCTKPISDRQGLTVRSSLQGAVVLLHLEAEASRQLQQNAPLMLYGFDITRWQDIDMRPKKLCERLSYLVDFREAIEAAGLHQHFAFPSIRFDKKRQFYEETIQHGGEGVILKCLNSTYNDSTSRSRYGWVKVKKSLEFDAYVSGFDPGRGEEWRRYVGCLHFSVLADGKPKLVAKVSALEWKFRKEISRYDRDTGKVSLDPEIYGRVARVGGQEFSAKAFRLVNPKIIHWRTDLKQDDCHYSLGDLESLRAGDTSVTAARIVNTQAAK